jgi:HPt (histidine-containing phosphotransfer) domain-containing protein
MVNDVMGLFMEDWPALETALRRAAAASDFQTLASVAHRLKGSAANIGAKRLARDARDAEARWSVADGHRAEALVDRIVQRVRELGALIRTTDWGDLTQ